MCLVIIYYPVGRLFLFKNQDEVSSLITVRDLGRYVTCLLVCSWKVCHVQLIEGGDQTPRPS